MIDGPSLTCGPWQEGPHGRWQRCETRTEYVGLSDEGRAIVARVREAVMRRAIEAARLTRAENATARRLIAEALGDGA